MTRGQREELHALIDHWRSAQRANEENAASCSDGAYAAQYKARAAAFRSCADSLAVTLIPKRKRP